MTFSIEDNDHGLIALYQGNPLFDYVVAPDVPAYESPRPYLHPVYTLSGEAVTGFQPPDHSWHHGISLTVAHLSGENFWGGPTYIRDEGYQQIANNGVQLHRDWLAREADDSHLLLTHTLDWLTQDGETWIDETRSLRVEKISAEAGYWCLDFETRLKNVRNAPLEFGSPTTEGRPDAGYGGFFWRGNDNWLHGTIYLEGGLEAQQNENTLIGKAARWLAVAQREQPSKDARPMLLFVDQPDNPRYPNKWFVRTGDYPGASFAFMYDEVLALEPGAELALNYRVFVINDAWTPEYIADSLG